jgi:hypothetical protein
LLIGENQRDRSPLRKFLARRSCTCQVATSEPAVRGLLGIQSFDLVLGPVRLHGDSLFSLIRRLDGSRTTLFFYQPVEDDCLWLPALRRGSNCWGAPALRSSEFVCLLDQIVTDIDFSSSVAPGNGPPAASRKPNVVVPFASPKPPSETQTYTYKDAIPASGLVRKASG